MKNSPASQQSNTILNYFGRTPSKQSNGESDNSKTPLKSVNSLTPKPSTPNLSGDFTPKGIKNRKSQLSSSTPNELFKSPKTPKLSNEKTNAFQLFDVVWAKLDGYPWWPSIICEDPGNNTFESKGQIHVQFFDDPVSHAWIRKRDLKPYTGSVQPGISVKPGDHKLKLAIEFAEEALDVEREGRFKLIGDLNLDDYDPKNSDGMSVDESDDSKTIQKPKNKFVTPSKRKKEVLSDLNDENSSDSEISVKSAQRKRFKRVLIDSDDENSDEDEFKPSPKEESSDESEFSDANSDDVETPSEDEDVDDEEVVEIKKNPTKSKATSNKSKNTSTNSKSNKSNTSKSFSMSVSKQSNNNTTLQSVTHDEATDREWPHLSYAFLQPEKICDSKHRKMLINDELNPDFDPTTLFVPSDFLNKQTPALRQWWEFKAANFDTILFFKMGKFYELFHMDAVVATKELQILFMRGENAHAGFPEKSYKRYADGLIRKGYKVARIEQTETPAMMEQRLKTSRCNTKFDKVVRREVCRISSCGTRYMSDIDSDAFADSNSYLFAFSHKAIDEASSEFGLCYVDVSIGKIYLSQFKDDHQLSKLRTLLSQYSPAEVIYSGSNKLVKLLDPIFPDLRKQALRKFWSSSQTLKYISENKTWANMSEEFKSKIFDSSDALEQTCLPDYDLAISSLGGIIEYLEKALIADDILSMGLFELYVPLDCNSSESKLTNYLILDSITIKNLEIFQNLRGEEVDSLFHIINNCCTPFGKRLLRSWLCLPLCNQREELEQRQEAVRDLSTNAKLTSEINNWCCIMKNLPDLERLLTQIHTQSSLKRSQEHPDSRAILFEGEIYRRRRIINFLNTLDGFEKIVALMEKISTKPIESKLLMKLTNLQESGGNFPELSSKISFFRNSFNAEKARKDGNIIPAKGVDSEYDDAIDKIDEVKKKLDDYLKDQTKYFNARVSYFGAGKNRFQLEIPEKCVSKALNSHDEKYELKSARKGFKRYHTTTIINLIAELDDAEAKKESSLSDIFRRLLERFDRDYQLWSRAIRYLAWVDSLISLSKTKQTFETNGAAACLPEFVWSFDDSGVMLNAEDLRNASLVEARQLIANNVQLKNGTLVLTGPNMAGKTTLMRSVGLMVILAQIGAYVPASKCQLTPVDRIFTRIGAYDQVIESQSTFMVELSETVTIVRHSTVNSLVLIDELGRGTSTFDGIAIAHAILEELAQSIHCRCIFSTHFHSIVDEIKHLPSIQIAHMAYLVENENKGDPTEQDVVFLYKLTEGVCSQSYGYNVAKIAGLPRDILRNSYQAGHAFEIKVESCRLLDSFVKSQKDPSMPALSEDKLDQLAQYLSEIIITRKDKDVECF